MEFDKSIVNPSSQSIHFAPTFPDTHIHTHMLLDDASLLLCVSSQIILGTSPL